MLEILGVQVPVTKKIFYTKRSPVVLDYLNAIKKGERDAMIYFKNVSV